MCNKVLHIEFRVNIQFCAHGAVCIEQDRVQRAAFCKVQYVQWAVFSLHALCSVQCVLCSVYFVQYAACSV